MNKLITHRITLSIIFVIVCQFTAKAQDSAKKVIVVVRPGGITSTTTTTVPTLKNPASAGNSSKYAAAPGAPGAVTPGTAKPASTGAPKTAVAVIPAAGAGVAAVAATTPKPAVTPYVAPGSRPHTYMAPSTSERVGTASYMHKTTTPAATTTTPAAGTPVVPAGTTGNASKYASAAPAVPVTVTPAVAPVKKDTVVITKIQKDTVVVPPAKHMGNKIAFLELGGPGLAISINYDMRFKKGRKDGLGFRAGVGYFAAGNNTVFTVPLMVNYLYGKDGKYIEIGLGTTFLNSKGDNYSSSTFEFDDVTGFIPTGLIGVRYEPNKALNFRLGYVPIIYDQGLINAGGFSIGYTF